MREVLPKYLWIGNAVDARNVKCVLDAGITAVVDLAIEMPPIFYPRDVVYCRFPLIDGSGNNLPVLRAAIDTTARFICGSVPTLVTCDGGMSRSPAVVAAALAAVEGTPMDAALQRVAELGPHDVSTTLWAEVRQACGL